MFPVINVFGHVLKISADTASISEIYAVPRYFKYLV